MKLIRWISERWRQFGKRLRIVIAVCLALLLAILLYPFQTTVVPQWSLRVADDVGAPVREIKVTEHWQNYLLESSGHEELQVTNQDGFVSFGDRNIRASLARRSFAQIKRFAGYPGGRNTYGSVVIWGSKAHETTVAVYQGEGLPQQEIRVRRLR